MKKILVSIKFLFCFSLLCVLFSSLPLLLQSLKPSLMQFFSYLVEKSYMFLFCNGLLLVLIAINSAPINASSPPTTERAAFSVHIEENSSQLESKEPDIAVAAAPIAAEETEFPQEEENVLEIVERENVLSDTQEGGNALVTIDEDVHDTEELNKKCEDFIKRMKATFSSTNLELRAVDRFYFDNRSCLMNLPFF
ncbi:hypothetical protein AAZX31_02G290800 [Glycine max]|uniref:DUF4408 domain-containing protein n=2 Tax=Glycine subgen. Soja TaxID=1462606 RepID=I1JJU4_SOYBN|nr:uncharacterized protein LOC100806244 [Glycine max]XP_028222802.1 uncharacterized protein LOC114403819 [Glycine soja]KAG5053538.1 hypothetical protein JHK87_005736 [Glycine soja]KAG5064863.1 hypothetical protein JHK85_006046 [Glycine max]KAG5081826.1 hypothetical protein JHK86_005891 [Glycine max]KAH1062958.1 hypothetical protein GYH30_005754 [Glycine max]KAH1263946.1 hypothetical protein GmHk_02G006207 [Glycine max]|eukprot:XP_003519685.1 uncharacterized protein LOC100806244 [Glycine max]